MTSCSEVEEYTKEEDGRQENSSPEKDKTLVALEATSVLLNWGQIFSLPNETRQHMVATLKHPELFADKVNWVVLRKNESLPVYKAHCCKMTKKALPGAVTSSKGLLQEESDLPTVHTSDGFDPNTYKLIKKSRYDFIKPPSMGHVIEAKCYGPNDMQ